MGPDGDLAFASYRLDRVNQQLWRDEATVPVHLKLFAVLRYMIENAGRVITREELLRAVWGRVYVDETLLRGTIRDTRALLNDDADAPKFIETMPNRGYRFLAEVTEMRASALGSQGAALTAGSVTLVERDGQLERALQVVGEARAHGSNAEQRFDQMQILRVKGELLFEQMLENAPLKTHGSAKTHPREGPCESAFEESIALCQKRGAKSLELRATYQSGRGAGSRYGYLRHLYGY